MHRKPGESDDFGREIVGCHPAPGAVGTPASRGRPDGLAGVEVARCPCTQSLRDHTGPIDPGNLGGEVRDRGKDLGAIGGLPRRGQERGEARGPDAGGGERESPLQVTAIDGTRIDAPEVPFARHRHRNAGDPRQPRGGLRERLAGLSQERVDRHAQQGARPAGSSAPPHRPTA